MKIVELIRLEESKFGTIGALKVNKQVFCFTLEPPDRENELNRSSIPAQQYICLPTDSPRFGKTFEVTSVPGRTNILFHAGNTVENTSGCILLGERLGKLLVPVSTRAILNSGATFKAFADFVGLDNPFHLTISEVY